MTTSAPIVTDLATPSTTPDLSYECTKCGLVMTATTEGRLVRIVAAHLTADHKPYVLAMERTE